MCHMRSHGVNGPFMVLGPLSTLPNWEAEFARWAPDFPALLYHGSREERVEMQRAALKGGRKDIDEKFPVVITSYEIAIADIKFFQKLHWK